MTNDWGTVSPQCDGVVRTLSLVPGLEYLHTEASRSTRCSEERMPE